MSYYIPSIVWWDVRTQWWRQTERGDRKGQERSEGGEEERKVCGGDREHGRERKWNSYLKYFTEQWGKLSRVFQT